LHFNILKGGIMYKIVIATHTQDDRRPDPELTVKGLADFQPTIESLLWIDQFVFELDFKEVIIGKGTRFDQMYRLGLLKIFPELPRRRSLLLANPVFKDDRRQPQVSVDPDATEIPSTEEIPVDKSFPPLFWWDWFMKRVIACKPKGDKLCLAGRGILHALGAPREGWHYSNRVFIADPEARTIDCLMENGELLEKPMRIPLRIGIKCFTRDDFHQWDRLLGLIDKALYKSNRHIG